MPTYALLNSLLSDNTQACPALLPLDLNTYVAYRAKYWIIKLKAKELLDNNPQAGLIVLISGEGAAWQDGQGFLLLSRLEAEAVVYPKFFTQACFLANGEQSTSKKVPGMLFNFWHPNG